MPQGQIDFSKYESAAPSAATIDFSKYEKSGQQSSLQSDLPGAVRFGGTLDALTRELSSAGKTIVTTPAAIYHAFSDEPTPEEIQKFGKDQVEGGKRVGLGLHRIIAQPVGNAAEYYKGYANASPEQRNRSQSDMLSVAPEAVGGAAGNVVAAKLASMAPQAVRAIPRATRATMTATGDVLKSPTTAAAIQKGGHYVGAGLGYEAGQAVGHPFMGAGLGAQLAKSVSPWVAEQFTRLGLKLSPDDLAMFGDRYFPSPQPDAMSAAVPPETDALTAAAMRIPPTPVIRGLLPRGPIPAQPAIEPEAPMAQPAARQVVRDPATGQMKVQYLTSAAEPNQNVPVNTPQAPISAQQAMQAQIARMRSPAPTMPAAMPQPSPEALPAAFQGLKPSSAVAVPETPAVPAQAEYPEGMNPRPTNRAEIVDDRAVQDQMRHDLNKHGWNALSEEKQKYYADNAPNMTKWQLAAQFQADQVMQEATAKVQQILEDARVKAETPARFTKTVIPKAPAPAKAAPLGNPGLDVNQDLTDILQRSLDAINAKKGK